MSSAADAISVLNHLHAFCGKLYLLHHKSLKSEDELVTCAQYLLSQLQKTGIVFSVRLVAVKATWRPYSSVGTCPQSEC
jgi:hypothetical protein